jgi:hypothetical protein
MANQKVTDLPLAATLAATDLLYVVQGTAASYSSRQIPLSALQSGMTGVVGVTGATGSTGASGSTGATGATGQSTSYWDFKSDGAATSGDPGSGKIIWNNATQIDATALNFSHFDDNGNDLQFLMHLMSPGNQIRIQDADNSANYQEWTLTGPITAFSGYDQFPVMLVSSGGIGTTNFPNNHSLLVIVARVFSAGPWEYKIRSDAPTAGDIPDGYMTVWLATGSGVIALYANVGGVIKSSVLT